MNSRGLGTPYFIRTPYKESLMRRRKDKLKRRSFNVYSRTVSSSTINRKGRLNNLRVLKMWLIGNSR